MTNYYNFSTYFTYTVITEFTCNSTSYHIYTEI